jgi:uncharacterized protein
LFIQPLPAPPALVLDTNTVLDWLVFKDPGMNSVATALQAGELCWLSCAAMREELARTLGYRSLLKWQPDSEYVLSIFDQCSKLLPAPPAAPLHLRCSDPDDQVFLELALAHHAVGLLTHDRALLKLARRARGLGLHISTPRQWLNTKYA